MRAVILAGGEGRRLLPYTTMFPKAMMPVGNRPILEIIVRQLAASGITDIIVATGYLEEVIRAHFGDGARFGVSMRYSHEDQPMGTAGPLSLVRDELRQTFLVMNGDILTDLDFRRLAAAHRDQASDVTVVLSRRSQLVDFGLVRINERGGIESWEEKPTVHHMVSAGIYLMEPRVLRHLSDGAFCNIPDFIIRLKERGLALHGFVHEGYWLDIGRHEDYEQACNDAHRLSNGT